jgi:hypothetical protein
LFLQKKIRDYEKERNGEQPEKITIKDAIKFTAEAWERVTSQTIINCWKKTGILPDVDNNSNETENTTSILNSLNVEEVNDLQNLIDKLAPTNPISASEYITIDDTEKDHEIDIDEQEIILMITQNEQNQEEEEVIEEFPLVSNKEALLAIEKLNKYIDQQSEKLQLSNNEIKPLKSLKRKIKKIEFDSNQQSTLDTFFN